MLEVCRIPFRFENTVLKSSSEGERKASIRHLSILPEVVIFSQGVNCFILLYRLVVFFWASCASSIAILQLCVENRGAVSFPVP